MIHCFMLAQFLLTVDAGPKELSAYGVDGWYVVGSHVAVVHGRWGRGAPRRVISAQIHIDNRPERQCGGIVSKEKSKHTQI